MLRKLTFVTVMSATLATTSASADIGIGVGFGALYNGIGINIASRATESLTFASLGCIAFSSSEGTSSADGVVVERTSSSDRTCGLGAGFYTTKYLSSSKHALGFSLGLNYDTAESDSEWSLTPSYIHFFNGIEQRGLNLGIGAAFRYRDSELENPFPLFNIGFQF